MPGHKHVSNYEGVLPCGRKLGGRISIPWWVWHPKPVLLQVQHQRMHLGLVARVVIKREWVAKPLSDLSGFPNRSLSQIEKRICLRFLACQDESATQTDGNSDEVSLVRG